MATVASKYDWFCNAVDPIAEKAKIDKEYAYLAAFVLAAIILFKIIGIAFFIDAFCFFPPFIASIKAVVSDSSDDDTNWLSYWLLFGLFKFFESIFGWILQYIPMYYFVKAAFLGYCYSKDAAMSRKLCDEYLIPFISPALNAFLGRQPNIKAKVTKSHSRDLSVFIDSVDLAKEHEDIVCDISVEKADGSSSERHKTIQHMSGQLLHFRQNFNFKVSASDLTAGSIVITVRTQPTFNAAFDSKNLGTVRYQLSSITDAQANRAAEDSAASETLIVAQEFTLVEPGSFSIHGRVTLD